MQALAVYLDQRIGLKEQRAAALFRHTCLSEQGCSGTVACKHLRCRLCLSWWLHAAARVRRAEMYEQPVFPVMGDCRILLASCSPSQLFWNASGETRRLNSSLLKARWAGCDLWDDCCCCWAACRLQHEAVMCWDAVPAASGLHEIQHERLWFGPLGNHYTYSLWLLVTSERRASAIKWSLCSPSCSCWEVLGGKEYDHMIHS